MSDLSVKKESGNEQFHLTDEYINIKLAQPKQIPGSRKMVLNCEKKNAYDSTKTKF